MSGRRPTSKLLRVGPFALGDDPRLVALELAGFVDDLEPAVALAEPRVLCRTISIAWSRLSAFTVKCAIGPSVVCSPP